MQCNNTCRWYCDIWA
ncbi:hypothetical protein L2Q10_05050 [Staphylococcus aureus]|nr:hypothetical protein [Staphylococcus aureus]MCE3132128.1 hypothetical protein [Staphylococcus aureus]MCF0332860.1 hypothetical protein [Staphylococcus aureus]MCG5191782.1 hypothetical protein [Staphylococcus aureus]MCG5637023.1 hypothetical protein [Staphylococcus aureus]MCG5659915.1 hypothetical protein [Staphylococcus aureus]